MLRIFCGPRSFPFLAITLTAVISTLMTGCDRLKLAGSKLEPANLTCNSSHEPFGVDAESPRFSWELTSREPEQIQTAYQLRTATSKLLLRDGRIDLWDSGRVQSGKALDVPYAGKPLGHSQRVFWQVRVWDKAGRESDWSAPAALVTGLRPEEWQAAWIRATESNSTTLLRKEFTVKNGISSAILHVCGLGQYELHVNGRQIGEDILTPGWTKYDRTCLFDTIDLTDALHPGPNALGLFLANGMYNVSGPRYKKFKGTFGPLQAIAQLEIEYSDGARETLVTDPTWTSHAGPITYSCIFAGEDYDARLEVPDWSKPGLDASAWQPVVTGPGPGGVLRGHDSAAAPLRTFESLKPAKVTPLRAGTDVYDMGQNAPFMLRFRVSGPAGSLVRATPAELVNEDGTVDRSSVGGGEAWWQYIKATDHPEEYTARFWYHGARYFQVERQASASGGALPEVSDLEGVVMNSASPQVGEFACSDDLFNRVYKLIWWAQRANLMSVITDCPHRERLGWLEQYHLNGPSLRYGWDLRQMFVKGMRDMADSQLTNGLVPDIAPEYVVFTGGFRDSPEWGAAVFMVPWQQYEWTGDTTLLASHYDTMGRYVAYLGSTATNNIVSHGLGDWYDLGPKPPGYAQLTPRALTATAFYYEGSRVLERAARLFGKEADAARFGRLAEEIKASFNQTFFDETTRQYATGSQCANAIPLVMNLAPEAYRSAILSNIVYDIKSRDNGLTAGDVGYRYVLRALADGGRADVVFDMNQQTDKPGYGYQLKQGATSLTEAWDARRSSSQNHFMLGHIMEWFYHDLAGLAPDPAGPGFEKILFHPQPVGNVKWARASYHSVRGPVTSSWRLEEQRFLLTVKVPPGSTGTVRVPGREPFQAPPAAERMTDESGSRIYRVGSGEHTFESSWQ